MLRVCPESDVMMEKKVIIWDFDGVIIDSKNLQMQALKECYRLLDKGEPPYDLFFSLSGDSLQNIFNSIGIPLSMVKTYIAYSSKKIDQIMVFDGIYKLLSELKKKEYGLALCTGKERKRTLQILKKCELYDFFSLVVCSDDVVNPKPNPESLHKCLDYFKITPERAVMVGDAPNDILAAKNAGVHSIAVLWGEGNREVLQNSGADHICESVVELTKILT